MLALTEDSRDKAGQPCTGSDFCKDPDAVGVHRLDLSYEFHRSGQLSGQKLSGCGQIGRVSGGGAVGIDRDAGSIEFDLINCGQERNRCVGNQRTVEGGRHRQALAGKFALGKNLRSTFYFSGTARQNRLGGSITIGDYQIQTFFGNDLLNGCQRGRDRQHAALVAGSGSHQAAAQPGQFMENILIEHTGRTEGGQFSVAVAAHRFG